MADAPNCASNHPDSNHPVAIITGASIGLGRALARALAERSWALVIDARRSDLLDTTVDELSSATTVIGDRGDVDRRRPSGRLSSTPPRPRTVSLVVNNASTLGASPLPALADLDSDDPARTLRGQRRRAARAGAELAPAPRSGRHRRQHHLRRRGRGLRGMGRLRRVEGRAGACRAGCWPPSDPTCGCSSSTPATCAPRCTRTPSPARTSPTGPTRASRARAARPDRRRPAERPLPGSRGGAADRGADMTQCWLARPTTPSTAPVGAVRPRPLRPRRRPRGPRTARGPRASDGTTCGCWCRPATTSPSHTRFDHLADHPRRRRPPRRQHVGHGARRARRHAARRRAGRRPRLDRAAGGALAGRGAPPDRPAPTAPLALDAAGARRPARRRAPSPARPVPGLAPAVAAPRRRRRGRSLDHLAAPRPTRSATATSPATGRSTPTRRVFAREPGSAEMPSACRPFTAELVTDLVARGVVIAPLVLHTGVSSLEGDEPPYPERYRGPAATAALVNAARARGGRVVAVGTTVVRALATVTDDRGASIPARAGPRSVVTPDDRRAGGRRPAHRLARARGVAPADARGRGRPPALERRLPAALAERLPLARVRRRPPAASASRRRR